jgi:MFS family permease
MSSAPLISKRPAIPRTVWALGVVSLLMDLSSELIHALLPLFLVTTMGMSVAAFGVLEGAAEATTMIVKVFSGPLSDWLGRRKGLLLAGYGLAALAKPLFPLASGPALVVIARLVDRIGKGIRGAPRDALVADVAPAELRGACFGLRQSLDTVGAIAGPLCATVLMLAFADRIRSVLWFACVPALLCVAVLAAGVREPLKEGARGQYRPPVRLGTLKSLNARYWFVVATGTVFALGRFSEAFLVLRAQQARFELAWIPLVMVAMNIAYTVSAYPVGRLSDRFDRRMPLALGLVFLVASDVLLGMRASAAAIFCGAVLWGLHMGFSQGILAAMVADTAPDTLRGTAFGVFNLASGVAMLLSGIVAGLLWERYGAPATFFAGAAFALASIAMCAWMPRIAPLAESESGRSAFRRR